MVGDPVLAEEAAAIFSDEHVVFNADAAEVLICFEFVEVYPFGAVARCAPVIDKRGDEVDAGFVGDHETGFEAAPHSEAIGAELVEDRSRLLVEAYINLAESLHVVDIEAHHVAESVRKEHGVCTGSYGLLRVAPHEAELFETVGHEAAHVEMDIHIFHTGAGYFQHEVMAFLHDRIDLELALRETSADRICPRVVAAIIVAVFRSGVAEGKVTFGQDIIGGIAVHYLAMLREDGGE